MGAGRGEGLADTTNQNPPLDREKKNKRGVCWLPKPSPQPSPKGRGSKNYKTSSTSTVHERSLMDCAVINAARYY